MLHFATGLAGFGTAINDDGFGVVLQGLKVVEKEGVGFLFVEQQCAGDVGGFVFAARTGVDPQDLVVPSVGDGFQSDFVIEKRFVDEMPGRGARMPQVGGGGCGQRENENEDRFSQGAHGGEEKSEK